MQAGLWDNRLNGFKNDEVKSVIWSIVKEFVENCATHNSRKHDRNEVKRV